MGLDRLCLAARWQGRWQGIRAWLDIGIDKTRSRRTPLQRRQQSDDEAGGVTAQDTMEGQWLVHCG